LCRSCHDGRKQQRRVFLTRERAGYPAIVSREKPTFSALLEFRRGRGISVAGTPERGAVVQKAKELVDLARHHGYRRNTHA